IPYGATGKIMAGIYNRHAEKVREIEELREAMAVWCAGRSALSARFSGRPLSDGEQAAAVYAFFKIDVLTAQSLNRADASAPPKKLEDRLAIDNIVKAA